MDGLKRSSWVPILIAVFVAFGIGVVAAGGLVAQDDPNPIAGVEGSLAASDLTVAQQELQYSGTSATGVVLTVDNAATSEVTGTAHVAVFDGNENALETATKSDVTVASDGDEITVSFVDPVDLEFIDSVEAVIEETG